MYNVKIHPIKNINIALKKLKQKNKIYKLHLKK